jgi:Nucleotidyltransferase of unknown function (DUF6036)
MPREKGRVTRKGAPEEPWRAFLRALDARLTEPVELHCIGGFAMSHHYGVGHQTTDIDFLNVVPQAPIDDLEGIAGLQSELHRKHHLYIQRIATATAPAGYASRLERMFVAAGWKHLSILALEAHDLALSKFDRNAERDRADILRLAQEGFLDARTLKTRYEEELRPYLTGNCDWHDKTAQMWLEMCWPASS